MPIQRTLEDQDARSTLCDIKAQSNQGGDSSVIKSLMTHSDTRFIHSIALKVHVIIARPVSHKRLYIYILPVIFSFLNMEITKNQ